MFNQRGGRGGFRNRINQIAQRFREAGATSPATAKTPEELGLPPRFQEAMHRRLGQTGIFVNVGGRYYLDEVRLAQMTQSGFSRGGAGMNSGRQGAREALFGLRIARLVIVIMMFLLIFANLFFLHSLLTWFAIGGLLIIAVAISILQIYYMSKARRMWRQPNFPQNSSWVWESLKLVSF